MLSRKSLVISLSCLAIVVIAGWYATRSTQTTTSPTVPAYMQEVVNATWQTFQPKSGAFEVLFPTIPQHVTKTASFGSTNEQVVYNVYSARAPDGTSYLLSTAAYPASFDTSNPANILEKLVQEMSLASPANEIIGQTQTTSNGFTAMDFDLQNIQFATLGRAILADKTLYVLTVMNPNRSNLEKNFHTFVNSFHLH